VSDVRLKRGTLAYIEREQSYVLIAVVDILDDGNRCFPRPAKL
jgi:hypothetical protein